MTWSLVSQFQTGLRQADETRIRVEKLHSNNKLLERDILAVYEGLFLRAVVAFEDLLEQVFFAILDGRSPKKSWSRKIDGSKVTLRKCVYEENNYLDWLPIKRTVDRACIYLKSGLPFSMIDDGEKSQISQVLLIRNAIAHRSTSALKRFQEKVIGNTPVPPRERRPAQYLRGFARPSLRRYEIFIQSLGGISNRFC